MLRLKHASINPAHIEKVSISGINVSILMVSETGSILVNLETAEDAIAFAAYVELLVDISNVGITETGIEMAPKFQSYFEHKDVLKPNIQYQEYKRLEKLLTEQRPES